MATYSGNAGSVSFAATVIGELTGWTLNAQVEILEDTQMSDKWATFKGGTGSWEGTATAHLDYGDAQQAAIIGDIAVATPTGDSVAAIFLVASGKTFTGNVLVESFSVDQARDAVVDVSFTFRGNGALTMTWA